LLEYERSYYSELAFRQAVADKPGPPVYLTQRLNKSQLAEYAAALPSLIRRAEQLAADLPGNSRIADTLQCLRNVRDEVSSLQNES
jgi:hypothetical protein